MYKRAFLACRFSVWKVCPFWNVLYWRFHCSYYTCTLPEEGSERRKQDNGSMVTGLGLVTGFVVSLKETGGLGVVGPSLH